MQFTLALAAVACVFASAAQARADSTTELNDLCASAVKAAIDQFPQDKIKDDDLAVTVLDLRDPAHVTSGSFRGDQPIFPASVVKLFYLTATHQWMQDGKLQDNDELRRAMKE